MLEKGRQGSADPDMTLFWQAVPAESALAHVSSSAGQGVPLLPCLLPAQSPVLLSPELPPLQQPFPECLGMLLSPVLYCSFSEGLELFTPTLPLKWHRRAAHIVVLGRDEGDPKWKLHLQSN